MTNDPKLEIPLPLRQLAEQNVEQTRAAFDKFVEMARQASNTMTDATRGTSDSIGELQQRLAQQVEENAKAGFSLASDLARARTVAEYMEIQAKWMQRQMQTYAEQSQEIGKLVGEAAKKMQPKA